MAEPKTVTIEQAQALLHDGYRYVDVRTEQEFCAGHAPNAFNVPFETVGDEGQRPNPEFLKVMMAAFSLDQGLVLGCKSGYRSGRAARELLRAGFSQLADLTAGFEGSRDHFGRKVPGWRDAGLAVETGVGSGRSYAALCRHVRTS